jgi:hypothetical protein
MHMYEMRSRKMKVLVDHNKYVMNEEQRLKEKGKNYVLIKPKEEVDEVVKDNHQVQALKKQIQTLQKKTRRWKRNIPS